MSRGFWPRLDGFIRTAALGTIAAITWACGGGGRPSTASTPVESPDVWARPTEAVGVYGENQPTWFYQTFWGIGDFNHDGRPDIVVSGWKHDPRNDSNADLPINPPAPVKLFVQTADGRFEDRTVALLGSETTVYAQQPLVGDVNNDGVDDIVLPGFSDMPARRASTTVFVSRGGVFDRIDVGDNSWIHGAALRDIDGDGCLDVVTLDDETGVLRGDCTGHFVAHRWSGGPERGGMHACLADFDGDGKLDLVVPDATWLPPRSLADTVIFEVDWASTRATAVHRLPPPVWDRANTGTVQTSHEQRCGVADLNGDGRMDVFITSTRWAADLTSWVDQSKLQVYLNRGGWAFEDVSDAAFPGRSDRTGSSFQAILRDLDSDGRVDLFYPADAWTAGQSNQIWLGNGDGTFRPAAGTNFAALLPAAAQAVRGRVGAAGSSYAGYAIPLPRGDGRYDFVVPVEVGSGSGVHSFYFELSRVGWPR